MPQAALLADLVHEALVHSLLFCQHVIIFASSIKVLAAADVQPVLPVHARL